MSYTDRVLDVLQLIYRGIPSEGCMGSSKKVFGDLIKKLNEVDSPRADQPK